MNYHLKKKIYLNFYKSWQLYKIFEIRLFCCYIVFKICFSLKNEWFWLPLYIKKIIKYAGLLYSVEISLYFNPWWVYFFILISYILNFYFFVFDFLITTVQVYYYLRSTEIPVHSIKIHTYRHINLFSYAVPWSIAVVFSLRLSFL